MTKDEEMSLLHKLEIRRLEIRVQRSEGEIALYQAIFKLVFLILLDNRLNLHIDPQIISDLEGYDKVLKLKEGHYAKKRL